MPESFTLRSRSPALKACLYAPAWPTTSKENRSLGQRNAATDHGLNWFARVGLEPKDQNFIGFYFDTGLTYNGLIPSRDDDTIGIAFDYAQLTRSVQQAFSGAGSTAAGAEMAFEFTYQAQITKWLTVQPDIQFIINPGGTQDLNNALVIGARAVIAF